MNEPSDASSSGSTATQEMSAFLRRLVHELRTPLGSMATVVDLLDRRDRPSHDLAETDRQARDILRRQVRLMLRRLDELADFARLCDGRLRLERAAVDAAALVSEEVEAHRSRAAEEERTLVLDVTAAPPPTAADGRRVRQIVRHLVDNALRHTSRGGRVEVIIDHDDRHARIRITDDGDGIEADRIPVIFDNWRRVDSGTVGHGRLGLGLAVARHLAELHGGSLHVSSDGAGRGSSFLLELPIVDPAAIPAESEPETPGAAVGATRPVPARSLRILVVEDHRFFGEAFAQALEQMDHAVSIVPTAREALAVIGTLRPDIIFSDISMPGMHGHDLARALRETADGADLVLVALTGSGEPEDRARSMAAGFDLHLVKPPDFETLRILFEDVARRRYGDG